MGDADITLRHLTRRHAEALARPYVPEGPLEIVGWADTQVTAVERRLDNTLLFRRAGALLALQIEFEYRHDRDLPERILTYQALSRVAFREERPAEGPPPMESVVILLTGRRRPWAVEHALRTGWRPRRWSGLRYRIDAVYQRTVAELKERGSPFWLAFTPLARDATAASMREVVEAMRAQVPSVDERADLLAALLVMADVDPWGHTLRREIEAMIRREPVDMIKVSKTLRDAYERGQREGREEGIEQGIERILRELLAKRLHRALTAREEEALAARAASDPGQVQDKVLALEGEALAAWLVGSSVKAPRRSARRGSGAGA
jgi:hypothetical protein